MNSHLLLVNIVRRYILLIFALLVLILLQSNALVSPSHPYVDDNNNGIDDFEEGSGKYADPEIRAKIYGVNFPIAELGSCANYYECRSFCEDPVNSQACIDYGKKRGFYKEEDVDVKKKEGILEKAKSELGCDSYETCKSFCQIPTNYEKCDSFAKKQGIAGGQVEDPKKKEVLEKAKDVLGCDSYSACAAYCSDDANRQKCSEFAKETGLRGGENPVGPGGCTSEQSCKAFCSDPNNFQVCKGFTEGSGGKFSGPGGCDSESACRLYCKDHEDECKKRFKEIEENQKNYNPQEMCNRTPQCAWKNNTCQCGFYGDQNSEEARKRVEESTKFCRENPAKCAPGGIGGFETREDKAAFEKFCRENPEKCRPAYSNYTNYTVYNPAIECSKYQGCAWNGSTCQCSASINPNSGYPRPTYQPQYSPPPQPTYQQTSMSREQQEAGCKSCGGTCNWSGDMCNCQCANTESSTYTQPSATTAPAPTQTSAPAPQPEQQSQPAPQPDQNTSQSSDSYSSRSGGGGDCPTGSYMKDGACVQGVQGVSFARGLFDLLLDLFR